MSFNFLPLPPLFMVTVLPFLALGIFEMWRMRRRTPARTAPPEAVLESPALT